MDKLIRESTGCASWHESYLWNGHRTLGQRPLLKQRVSVWFYDEVEESAS